jgi:hypothetical protein
VSDIGQLFDLNGRLIGKVDSMSRHFLYAASQLQKRGEPFFAAAGPCRARPSRELVSALEDMGVNVVRFRPPELKPDVVLLLEGSVEELERLR